MNNYYVTQTDAIDHAYAAYAQALESYERAPSEEFSKAVENAIDLYEAAIDAALATT